MRSTNGRNYGNDLGNPWLRTSADLKRTYFDWTSTRASGRRILLMKLEGWAHVNRSMHAHLKQLCARVGCPPELLADVAVATGHNTVYHQGTDTRKLLKIAETDGELYRHIRNVLRIYVSFNDTFTRNFLNSDAGALLVREFSMLEHDGEWHFREDLTICDHCDEPMFPDEREVLVRFGLRDGEYNGLHRDCVENSSQFFYCSLTNAWYYASDMTCSDVEDFDGEVCVEACLDRGLIIENEDDDGDPNGTYVLATRSASGRLAGYHSAPRPWRTDQASIPNGYIGVELELGFKTADRGRSKFLDGMALPNGRAKDGPFLFERDGSLGGVPGGMEIVSDPLPLFSGYQAENAAWRKMLKALYEAGAEGWIHRRLAGIHVNVCVCDESETSIFKYASFIGNAAAMSKLIAGRRNIFGAPDGYWKVEPHLLRGADRVRRMNDMFSHGKYSAVNRRNEQCLETRIFGSNIRYEGFMACVEYCVAVMEFVRPLHILDVSSPTAAAEFRNWLGGAVSRFPNLAARLGVVTHPRGTAVPATSRIVPAMLAA